MYFIVFYSIATVLLILSLLRSREKTLISLKKTLKGILRLLPQMSFIILLIGLSLAVISPESISSMLGSSSGLKGILIAIGVGSVSFLPSFIAFPLGATLLEQGAGIVQIAGFISSLMGIGIVTFSMEKDFFGTPFAVYRNLGSLIMTIIFIALIAGLLTGGMV